MKQTIALKLLFGVALTLSAVPASAQTHRARPQQRAVAQASEQVCLTCHGSDPKVTAILQSPMAMKGDPRTPFAQGGCLSCHGTAPTISRGRSPYPDIVFKGPNTSPVAVRNEVCLSCHEGGARMNWEGSAHAGQRPGLHRLPYRARGEGPGDW